MLRQHQHRNLRVLRGNNFNHFQPVAGLEGDIRHHQIGLQFGDRLQGSRSGRDSSANRQIRLLIDEHGQALPHYYVGLDQQDPGFASLLLIVVVMIHRDF